MTGRIVSIGPREMIIHIDMDAFYASIEQRDHPELAGRPVIVGGSPEQRGVVSTASYEARKFGIHSAMPSATARNRCPHAVFLPVRMDRYREVSQQLRTIFERYTPLVEPISLDEAFLDVTGSEPLFGPAAEIAGCIQLAIRTELRLTASAGVAENKLVAKIASDQRKPGGLVVVPPEATQSFLDPLPIGVMWGIGARAQSKLARLGIRTIAHLRALAHADLVPLFGEAMARTVYCRVRGVDDRPVECRAAPKSISHERTFALDVGEIETLRGTILELVDLVGKRLREKRLAARSVHIKARRSDFQTLTRSRTLAEATSSTAVLARAALDLFDRRIPRHQLPLRLIGVGLGHLGPGGETQTLLFDDTAGHRKLDTATDAIRDRFGGAAIQRGISLFDRDRTAR